MAHVEKSGKNTEQKNETAGPDGNPSRRGAEQKQNDGCRGTGENMPGGKNPGQKGERAVLPEERCV